MAEAQQELDLEEEVEVQLPEGKQAQVATEEGTPVVQEESAKRVF